MVEIQTALQPVRVKLKPSMSQGRDDMDLFARVQKELDEKVWTTDNECKIHPNVLNEQGDRQIVVLLESSSILNVACRLCHAQCWRYDIVGDTIDAATMRDIIHKARMHCGHFKSTSASRHRLALRNVQGCTSRSPERRPNATKSPPPKRPRLHIFDVNGDLFVDLKRDRGRAIRQHRVTNRLKALLPPENQAQGKVDCGFAVLAAAATAISQHLQCSPLVEKRAPTPLSGLDVMDLMTVLLEHDYVDKLPVSRAADVRALREVRDLLLKSIPWLCLDGGQRDEIRQILTMAVLFVCHQLWTPSRMRRFSLHLVDVLPAEEDDDPTKWGSWMKLALLRSDADVVDDASLATMHQEIAMENDVFTGRHRTRTTVSAVLQAQWPEQWANVMRVARHFVRSINEKVRGGTICDAGCRELVDHAKCLPDVGGYIGAHLVRSLIAVFGLRIHPIDAWGAFTMSDDSVGALLDRIKPLGLLSPEHLAMELSRRLKSSSSPTATAKRAFFESTLCDAGVLALILCETHSCCALVERHRHTHPSWRLDKVLNALRSVPTGWTTTLRKTLIEEYDLNIFDPDVVYHPAHKLVQMTMVVKGHHDLCRANKPPKVIELRPRFRVVYPEREESIMPTTPTKPIVPTIPASLRHQEDDEVNFFHGPIPT